MKNKYINEQDEFFVDEDKAKHLSKQDNELFNENSYVVHDMVGIKRNSLPHDGEEWEILLNKKPVLVLKGIRFSKKEREFFRKPDGMKFLIDGYKQGWKTASEFKKQIKKCL